MAETRLRVCAQAVSLGDTKSIASLHDVNPIFPIRLSWVLKEEICALMTFLSDPVHF